MYVVILTTLIALFLSYLASKKQAKYGLEIAFVVITFIQAIHYNYGNDYMGYYEDFKSITSNPFNWSDLMAGKYWKEPGWALINFIFKDCGGFFMMVAALSIVYNIIYYNLIRHYLPRNLWFFGVFVYLFSCYDLYLMNMSMLRQGMAIALFAYAYKYIINKNILISGLLIFIAYSIHSSAIILIPFIFIGYLKLHNSKIVSVIFILLFAIFFLSTQLLSTLMEQLRFIAIFDSYSEDYIESGDVTSFGLGFLLRLIPFLVYLIVLADKKSRLEEYQKYAIILAASNFLVEPFSKLGVMIVRMGYYFNALSVIAIPIAFSKLDKKYKYVLLPIYVMLMFYMYYGFFEASAYSKAFRVFHTIFEVL